MRRYSLAVFLAVAGLVGGVVGFTIYARENRSPFAFGEARPGVAFEDMDDDSQRYQGKRFACTPIAAQYRVCEVATDGPAGKMGTVVDDRGRVIIVRMAITDSSPRVNDLTRTVWRQWDSVAAGMARTDESTITIDWRSNDRHWSARMRLRPMPRVMHEIAIADERALARMDGRELRLLVPLIELTRRGLVPDTLLAAIETRDPGALLRAVDSLSADGRRRALSAASVPSCPPALSPVAASGDPEQLLGERLPVVEQMLRQAYGGRQLIFADEPYLVDATGMGEPVRLTELTEDYVNGRVAFAVTFSGRVDSVEARLASGGGQPRCRAGVEIVEAHIDTATRAVSAVRRLPLEDEALATRAKSTDFLVAGSPTTPLVVTYESTYGDSSWHGSVAWQAVLGGESGEAVARIPVTFSKTAGGREVNGIMLADTTGAQRRADAADAISGRRVRVLLIEPGKDASPISVTMPSAVRGAPSGWTLLAMF